MTKKRSTPARLRREHLPARVAIPVWTKSRSGGRWSWYLDCHFPTRDALIEGVYRNEAEKLTAAAAGRFAETMSPIEALRTWMLIVGPFR
jgi:hypothetical protein